MVKDVAEMPMRIKEAFEIATSGRPGPVLVDLPKDVQASILRRPIPTTSSLPSHPSAASLAARDLKKKQLDGAIKRAARLVNISKKPVIYAGQGLLATPEGPKLLREFADKACIVSHANVLCYFKTNPDSLSPQPSKALVDSMSSTTNHFTC